MGIVNNEPYEGIPGEVSKIRLVSELKEISNLLVQDGIGSKFIAKRRLDEIIKSLKECFNVS